MKNIFKGKIAKVVAIVAVVVILMAIYALWITQKKQGQTQTNTNISNGSSQTNISDIYVSPGGEEGIQAIYLAPRNGGLITDTELKKYPQILKVTDFKTLNSCTSTYIIPIWIDKDAIDLLPQGWLREYPQKFYPIIVVGFSNALYAMREKLNLGILGPRIDWSKETLGPGFSAWMIEEYGESWMSSFMRGYQEDINVSHILEVSNGLFKQCFKTIQYKNTEYGFTFDLPLTWQGYKIIKDKWTGYSEGANGEVASEEGPLILIRSPQWTKEVPTQDIPIMVFTLEQWDTLQQEKFHIGAAPIGPTELGRNSKYVFALPARYNYAFPKGFEVVEEIINTNPLKGF
ncbi:MAG: hypothetical protein JHC30_03325 [Caldisericum sp.]|jgi:hypothetical protein|nr:hypothetical protein [Caldisericum sp.]MCI4463184.1 hypothetical protein [Caldisericum sp.]